MSQSSLAVAAGFTCVNQDLPSNSYVRFYLLPQKNGLFTAFVKIQKSNQSAILHESEHWGQDLPCSITTQTNIIVSCFKRGHIGLGLKGHNLSSTHVTRTNVGKDINNKPQLAHSESLEIYASKPTDETEQQTIKKKWSFRFESCRSLSPLEDQALINSLLQEAQKM